MKKESLKMSIVVFFAFVLSLIACFYIIKNYSFVNGTVNSIKMDMKTPIMSDTYYNGIVKVSYNYNGHEMVTTHDSYVANLNVGDNIILFVKDSSGESGEIGYLLMPFFVIFAACVYFLCYILIFFKDKTHLHKKAS